MHDLVLAVAALEIPQLDVEVALLLSPYDGNRLVDRLTVLAMADSAWLDLFGDALGGGRYGTCAQHCCEDSHAGIQPNHLAAHHFIPTKSCTLFRIMLLTETGPWPAPLQ